MALKLCVEQLYDLSYVAYNSDEFDGAPDAGPQMVGYGKTAEEAKAEFMDLWLEREAERDMKAALARAKVWDGMLDTLFGRKA